MLLVRSERWRIIMKNNCDYEKVIKELEIIVLKQEEEINNNVKDFLTTL